MQNEHHPFKMFLPEKPIAIIIGTFPCLDFINHNYGNWFYSTNNKNLLWPILSKIFKTPAFSREEKENLLSKKGLGMADIGQVIQRFKNSCADSDLTIVKPNEDLLHTININQQLVLYFTNKNAEKFTELHYFKNYGCELKNIKINLPSPSKNASRSIARTEDYKVYKSLNPNENNTFGFRVQKYSELLNTKS